VPGGFDLPRNRSGPSRTDPKLAPSVTDPSIAFDELLDALVDIHNVSKTDVPFRVFSNSAFSGLRTVMERLVVPNDSNADILRNRPHLKSSCRLAVLFSTLTIFLDHWAAPHEQREAQITHQLDEFQQRILANGLDRQGSVEKLWHIMITKRGWATVALEARERQTVRLMNLAKQLRVSTIDEIAGLLWVYLKDGTKGDCIDSMYAHVVERIRGELQTL
jgi:hypothetical protein